MRGGVFVCHASQDAGVAQRIVAALEAGGVPCWIAPRDIDPGESYAQAILDGLDSAPAVVLLFSAATNDSPHVQRELETAVSAGKPIIPVRLEGVEPSRSLRYFIGTSQWLDAVGAPSDLWEPPLVRAVRRAVGQQQPETHLPPAPTPPTQPSARRPRKLVVGLPLLLLLLVGGGAVGVAALRNDDPQSASDRSASGGPSTSPTGGVTCWDGTTAEDRDACGVPSGRAGLATVFPSLTPDCVPVTSSVEGAVEVFECRRDGYLMRFTRWVEGYDRYAYYDAQQQLPSTEWYVDGEFAGRQWVTDVAEPGATRPYRWSASYRYFPFSVRVEAVTEDDRRTALEGLEVVAPSHIGLR